MFTSYETADGKEVVVQGHVEESAEAVAAAAALLPPSEEEIKWVGILSVCEFSVCSHALLRFVLLLLFQEEEIRWVGCLGTDVAFVGRLSDSFTVWVSVSPCAPMPLRCVLPFLGQRVEEHSRLPC